MVGAKCQRKENGTKGGLRYGKGGEGEGVRNVFLESKEGAENKSIDLIPSNLVSRERNELAVGGRVQLKGEGSIPLFRRRDSRSYEKIGSGFKGREGKDRQEGLGSFNCDRKKRISQ